MVAMEGAQEPVLVSSEPYVSGAGFKVALPLPAVALVQLCAQPTVAPAAPTQLKVLPVQGGKATALHWVSSDEGKAVLQTYMVEESVDGGAFARLATQNLIASAWLHRHERSAGQKRCYRVSAKNYWGRVSAPTSEPACTTATAASKSPAPPPVTGTCSPQKACDFVKALNAAKRGDTVSLLCEVDERCTISGMQLGREADSNYVEATVVMQNVLIQNHKAVQVRRCTLEYPFVWRNVVLNGY